jgi:hypothetical protein
MLKLEDVNIADSEIIKTFKTTDEIIIICNSVFNLATNKYVDKIKLTVKHWSSFRIKIFISSQPFSIAEETILKENEFEDFEVIQEVVAVNNLLWFRGFSKNSGNWMEYLFENATFEIT